MKSKFRVFSCLLLPTVISTLFLLNYQNVEAVSTPSCVDDHKIDICHRTNSNTNPYTTNKVDKNSTAEGHSLHTGPIWFPGINGDWGDIIPPFDYQSTCPPTNDDTLYKEENCSLTGYTCEHGSKCALPIPSGTYAGMNWTDAGQAIWKNKCNIPADSYVGCSIKTSVPGDWSVWSIDTQDDSKLMSSRTITYYDSKNTTKVCSTEVEKKFKDRELCQWETAKYADDQACVKPTEPETPTLCEYNSEILASNPLCVKPVQNDIPQVVTPDVVSTSTVEDDTPAVLGTTTVALANTAGGDTFNRFLVQSILSFSAGFVLIYAGSKKFLYIA